VFAVFVALGYTIGLFALVPGRVPTLGGGPAVSAIVGLAFVALLVAPAALHLTAALQTVLLILLVRERAGVSETVQVLAYATAPCVLAGIPIPGLRLVCAAYGAALLALGVGEVHGTSLTRAVVVTAVPSALVFGYGFGGFGALESVLRSAGFI
jgi:hypothetical protein